MESVDASSSVFASLALVACQALGLDIELRELSRVAMLREPSAGGALTGSFSRFRYGPGEFAGSTRISPDGLRMGILIPLVERLELSSSGMPSHLMPSVAEMPRLADELELAIRQMDVGRACMLAERYSFLLRGASMTGVGEELVWQPDALRIIRAVRSMRDEGLPAFFSMTGNGIFINTLPGKVDTIAERLGGMGFDLLKCEVGGPARLVDEHLF